MSICIKTLISLVTCAIFSIAGFAEENEYNYNTIPDSLKKNANAVIRKLHEEIKIVSPGEVYISRSFAITILNEKGKQQSQLYEYYNSFTHIEQISGRLYDAKGNEIKKLKKDNVKDMGLFEGDLINDDRYKFVDFDYSSYPYTCEYEIEIKKNTVFEIPAWSPQEYHDRSVEAADITVIYPKDFPLRYRTFHTCKEPFISSEGDNNRLSFSLRQLCACQSIDEFVPADNFYYPTLLIVADKFELDGHEYDMATWQDFGNFFYKLAENRDELSDEMKKMVHDITDTCTSVTRKINLLYKYLQKNTRYISVQLGIGGWQPFDAKFVSEKGYGDCKALSNYMKSLLKEAGITAYPALVYGGERQGGIMIPDFPFHIFNHIILCVPKKEDTLWLECTSQTLPTGYLSEFTSNRDVLLVTPDGGFPIKTPVYTAQENTAKRKADIYIDEKDEISGNIDVKYRGYFWDIENHKIGNEPKSKIEKHLNSELPIANYQVSNCNINNDVLGSIPSLEESFSITGFGNITRNGKNISLSPRILPYNISVPSSFEQRKTSFQIQQSYTITDTIIFHLNGVYKKEFIKETNLSFPFAVYHSNVFLINDSILEVTVGYVQKEGIYSPELFTDYVSLSKKINIDALNEKVYLTRVE